MVAGHMQGQVDGKGCDGRHDLSPWVAANLTNCRPSRAEVLPSQGLDGPYAMLRIPALHHANISCRPYKWLLLADDDSYMVLPNVLKFLQRKATDHTIPLYLGCASAVSARPIPAQPPPPRLQHSTYSLPMFKHCPQPRT